MNPNIGSPPSTKDPNAKIEWCVQALFEITRWLNRTDINNTADAYSTTGVLTKLRTFDAAAGTLADVRSTLGTLIQDLRERGSKGI